jgi:uncharacterized protein YgiM (DUF1202 family)
MIKMLNIILGAAMISLSAVGAETQKTQAQGPAQPVKGVVKSAVLNVRVKPGPRFSAVSKLKRGDDVAVLRQMKDWYEIVLPADASVWVAASQLKDGKTLSESKLRAGPGVAYEAYVTTVPVGIEVNVQDKSKPDWIKIAAPSTLTGWVSKEYINVSAEDAKKLEPDAAAAKPGDSKDVKTAAKDTDKKDTVDAAARPEDKKAKTADKEKTLPFIADSDKNVTLEGDIYPLDKKTAVYVTHALFKPQKNGDPVLVCYLHASKLSLAPWNEKSVQIKGKQRMVRKWKTPVVEVEKVTPQL